MSSLKELSARQKKLLSNITAKLGLMPRPLSELHKEQLIYKVVEVVAQSAALSAQATEELKEHALQIDIGFAINHKELEQHRPLAIPNQKYPCVSEQSEKIIWQAYHNLRPGIVKLLYSDHMSQLSNQQLHDFIAVHLKGLIVKTKTSLNEIETNVLLNLIVDDINGFGPLEMLLVDPAITDILVNGFDKIYVERNGLLKKCLLSFRDNEHLVHVIRKIVTKVGRRIDYASPYVDARMPDGSRVNAVIPPISLDAPSLSIRRFGTNSFTLDYMIRIGSISLEMASFLSLMVRAKANIIISGGAGSGKTTMLNAMSWAIDPNDRVVTLEDSAELKLSESHEHVVRLETRKLSFEGKGEINEQNLLKNALRMRPDRIILGEARSGEAFDMLQAMNTGHSGSMCTIHANTVDEVAARLCNMVSMGGVEISESLIMKQLSQVLHIIVQVSRMRDGRRRVVNISEVTGNVVDNKLELNPIFVFEQDKSSKQDRIVGDFKIINKSLSKRCLQLAINAGLHSELLSLFES